MIARSLTGVIVVAGLAVALVNPAVSAQKKSGPPNIQVGGDSGAKASRMELITKAFTLDDEQARQFRAAFDEGQKNAAPIKLALTQAHVNIGAAIQAAKGQTEIDTAVLDYATQSAAMTSVEVKSLAAAMKSLRPEQLANQKAIDGVLTLVHGMYLGKWDSVPDGKTY